MQRVLVVSERTPFVDTERDALCAALLSSLAAAGIDAEASGLPSPHADMLVADMLARRCLHVWNADRLIALSFPACLIAHPRKIVWLVDEVHVPATGRTAAKLALREATRVYARNRDDARRLFGLTGCRCNVLPLPVRTSDWRQVLRELLA